jgi:hypothetical protein
MAIPVPLRAQYRQSMNELMRFVVKNGWTLDAAFSEVPVAAADVAALRVIANIELDYLAQYNCGVYNLPRQVVQRWIDSGRQR